MDFKRGLSNGIAYGILFLKNCYGLIFFPYNTMRKISLHGYYGELFPIYFFSFLYFFLSNKIRQNQNIFLPFLVFYGVSIIFFSCLPGKDTVHIRFKKYIKTWTNTLLPTLIWFYSNMFFFITLPPPRSLMITGKAFSVFFIAFSVSLLIWKLILVYLSLRFSSRISFLRIIYYIILYLMILIPLSLYFYQIGISRIPFV